MTEINQLFALCFVISQLADTTHTAAGALNASHAYESIVEAINDAENASRAAVDASMKALDQSNGLAERARKSKIRSQDLKDVAEDTKSSVVDGKYILILNFLQFKFLFGVFT